MTLGNDFGYCIQDPFSFGGYMTYRDRTFCASTACQNKCNRRLSDTERNNIPNWMSVSYTNFCCNHGLLIEDCRRCTKAIRLDIQKALIK